MATIKPPRRGRPSRHPVDALRTRVWFQAVKLSSGLASAYAIEQALEGRPAEIQVWRPRKWDAYERGRKVPEAAPGRPDVVSIAQAAFPGTARWFRSPMWQVLRQEPMSERQIESGLLSLDESVTGLLFQMVSRHGRPAQLEPVRITQDHLIALAQLGSFDALVATVLLVALSSLTASSDLREWALDCYADLQPFIADAPQMRLLYPELFNHIDHACPHWLQVAPNQRLEIHIFWHEQARMSWASDRVDFIDAEMARLRAEWTP